MKTLIAIPCMDHVHTEFMTSLVGLRRPGESQCAVTISSLVYDSRNRLASQAIEGGFDRILWLDSDMKFRPDLMERLAAHLDDGCEFVSGLYFTRKQPINPVIYSELKHDITPDGANISVKATPYWGYPKNQLIEIQGAGFGVAMMTTDLVKRVWDNYGPPFLPLLALGEDLSFCKRVHDLGSHMFCDTSIKALHIGLADYGESE